MELKPSWLSANNTVEVKMNYVIGLDGAKGSSVAQACLERGKPFGKAKRLSIQLKDSNTFKAY